MTNAPDTVRGNLELYAQLFADRPRSAALQLGDPDALQRFAATWMAAWQAHDTDAIVACCTPDVVWEDPVMFGRHARGHAEIRTFTDTLFASFPDLRFEPVGAAYIGLGVSGIGQSWRMTGTFDGHPLPPWPPGSRGATFTSTGRTVDVAGFDVYTLRGARVVHWRIMYDPMELAVQLGLLPHLAGPAGRFYAAAQRLLAPALRRRASR